MPDGRQSQQQGSASNPDHVSGSASGAAHGGASVPPRERPVQPEGDEGGTAHQGADTNGRRDAANGDRSDARQGEPSKPGRTWVKPLMLGLLALGLIIGIIYGINYWRWGQTHVSTDDAYVTGNLVSVSPIISGTLAQLTVDEGYQVKRGQLIARLDPSGPMATMRQAQANYKAALSQVPEAERNLIYQQEATRAAIQKAQAGLRSQQARALAARNQVSLAAGTSQNQIRQARAQVKQAQAQADQFFAQVQSALAGVENYRQAVKTAQASLENYQQQVQTAQKAAQAAAAHVQGAQADLAKAARDEARYRVLYTQDAVSAQQYDQARDAHRDAQANFDAAQAQNDEAQSQVAQARASVKQAQSQVAQAQQSVVQAQAQATAASRAADASQQQVTVARAALGLAQVSSVQVPIQNANLASTTGELGSSEADVETARAGEQEVAVRKRQIETYRAQAQQAAAALTNAQITLGDTNIYAPDDGTVVRKTANVGASLAPGQSILTMTQGSYVWVEANFKETQLKDVRPGESAEIGVDAFPGKVFKGRVQSINEATGAATSLLPPDNATGNFTKVVQRVPVRIELVAASDNDDSKYARADDIRRLRQGMSVDATIDTGEKSRQEAGEASSAASGGSGQEGQPGSAPGTESGGPAPNGAHGEMSAPSAGTASGQNGPTSGGAQSGPAAGGAAGGYSGAFTQPGSSQVSHGSSEAGTANPGSGQTAPGSVRSQQSGNAGMPGGTGSGLSGGMNATNGSATPGSGMPPGSPAPGSRFGAPGIQNPASPSTPGSARAGQQNGPGAGTGPAGMNGTGTGAAVASGSGPGVGVGTGPGGSAGGAGASSGGGH